MSSVVQTLALPHTKRRRRRRPRPAFDKEPTATLGVGDLDHLLSSLEAAVGSDDELPTVLPPPTPPRLPGMPPPLPGMSARRARASASPQRARPRPPAPPAHRRSEVPSISRRPPVRSVKSAPNPLANAPELRPLPSTLQTLETLAPGAPRRDAESSAVVALRKSAHGSLVAGIALASAIIFGWLVAALATFPTVNADGQAGVLLALIVMSPAAAWIAGAVTRRCGGGRRTSAVSAVLGGLLGLAAAWGARAALPALAAAMPVPTSTLPHAIEQAAQMGVAARDALLQPGLIAAWTAETALCLAAILAAARPARRRAR